MQQQSIHYAANNTLYALGVVQEIQDGRWLLVVAWPGRQAITSVHATAGEACEQGRSLIRPGHACGGACSDWREMPA
jgi:hypothetical protein